LMATVVAPLSGRNSICEPQVGQKRRSPLADDRNTVGASPT
jgi:hypothetical protein